MTYPNIICARLVKGHKCVLAPEDAEHRKADDRGHDHHKCLCGERWATKRETAK